MVFLNPELIVRPTFGFFFFSLDFRETLLSVATKFLAKV